ncbi:bacteriocin immunity protein [Citrobacter freundii]|nr:bacteriocin immunity protein [Citrobacter freundii]WGA92060.1 bacteriocin immunity protein [Citrobacter freundii]
MTVKTACKAVINEIKRWRKFQGRPSFKQFI